ncbi:carbohydrate esterase family 4 protein [Zopfia rhizophila CBS 207.26]|uniref:Carbohydrate esterase family 4 protein n=1 Tax=Zopfia rhizophila CBS 207.26 TaxID=1314779 RepID=A0A6A6DTQ9_9PEZI|nr:carbohydrate esterase family 4 protein [Zopfia rhizophila CBS 207.26]
MRFTEILAASLVAPLVAAHGDEIPHMPKIFGRNPIEGLRTRNAFQGHTARDVQPQQGSSLKPRQGGVDGQCGPSVGGARCASGYCCSAAGWCGQGNEYCQAPDCLFQYSDACDANQTPSGTTTRNVARTKVGSVPYGGAGIYQCLKAGTIAITYDDGPYIYTAGVLDQFKSYGAKATFFITGNNNGKGAIDNSATAWPAVIKRMYNEGHQIASHTWSHQDLSAITKEQRYDQMIKNEMAIRNIIGKFPTYMRPPYSSCTAESGCEQDMADLGYHVSYFDLDTDDYNNVTPDKIQNAKNNFKNKVEPSNPSNTDWLAIAHDIHQQTAQNLTGYMLETLTKKGFKAVTMGECMNDPAANWYRDSAGSVNPSSTTSSARPTSTAKTSPDGTCGGTNGYTCIGFELGSCCSQYGWCGSTSDHCGTGCNNNFGTCGSGSSASSVRTSATPTPTSTKKVSTDGTCAGTNGFTCQGSAFGNCCSQYGWCGTTTGHCGTGCNRNFGTCS